jgi:hypothetical protein
MGGKRRYRREKQEDRMRRYIGAVDEILARVDRWRYTLADSFEIRWG